MASVSEFANCLAVQKCMPRKLLEGRPIMHGETVWMKKLDTAWRTTNADKTKNRARALARAVRPGSEAKWHACV